MRGLEGKRLIVTGAAGGIGAALVQRLHDEGATLGLIDLSKERLEAIKADLSSDRIQLFDLDITDHQAVSAAVDQFADAQGGVDGLVNNAGWDRFALFMDTDPDFWDKVIAVNLRGPINLHHAVLPHMRKSGGGKIVNVSSDAGRVGSSGEAVYAACKGGLISFSKTIAREHARDGVRVNCVCPGPTDTPLFHGFIGEGEAGQKVHAALERAIPLKRIGKPDDFPGLIAFLLSDDADYITGQTISVSGGLTMNG